MHAVEVCMNHPIFLQFVYQEYQAHILYLYQATMSTAIFFWFPMSAPSLYNVQIVKKPVRCVKDDLRLAGGKRHVTQSSSGYVH